MFAPRTYWRLFELHNEAWWPLQPVAVALALGAMAWLWGGGAPARRAWPITAAALALTSAFVAKAFLVERYVPINWAAEWVARLFAAQAVLLILLALRLPSGGVAAGADVRRAAPHWADVAAPGIAAWALLGQPWLAPLTGRPITQAEVFALAPDPTALATLAWLLAAAPVPGAARWPWRLAAAAAGAALAASAATLLTMGEWLHAGVLLAAMAWALAAHRARAAAARRP
jgi:hypothetical protein